MTKFYFRVKPEFHLTKRYFYESGLVHHDGYYVANELYDVNDNYDCYTDLFKVADIVKVDYDKIRYESITVDLPDFYGKISYKTVN